MTNGELIEKLSKHPKELEVKIYDIYAMEYEQIQKVNTEQEISIEDDNSIEKFIVLEINLM